MTTVLDCDSVVDVDTSQLNVAKCHLATCIMGTNYAKVITHSYMVWDQSINLKSTMLSMAWKVECTRAPDDFHCHATR